MVDNDSQPVLPREHRGDAYATKFIDKTGDLHDKAKKEATKTDDKSKEKGPEGGFDGTPIPQATVGYTVKFTFHRAKNLPMADINTLSSDPYVLAQLNTSIPKRHKEDPELRFRTRTIRRNVEPKWESHWIVANVPPDGFNLKARVFDEDPADHDDRLGNVYINVDEISEDWEGIREKSYEIKKRSGSKRAYFVRGCAAMFLKGSHMSGELIVSIQVLSRSEEENGGRLYTVGPCNWSQHLSPMIGRLAGTKDPDKDSKPGKNAERYNFQANQIQLAGPVPEKLYHRYVEFKPFVAGMFTSHSLRGRLLNRALHHQHARIYNFDRSTKYGSFPAPSKEMTLEFLDLVHFDQGGRVYTYVIGLDGQWRFTETGKEFGIDLLSKHTMHSDVSIFIAFSGEFFIRRLKNPWKDPEEQETHPPNNIEGGPPKEEPTRDPKYYQLVIDNDSGTYRPNRDLLPLLKNFMHRNLPGLQITTLDCLNDEEKMKKMKSEQHERKTAEGESQTVVQGDADSISSSDEDNIDAAAGQSKERGKMRKVAHEIAQPKEKLVEWVEGNKEREQREEDDDSVAAGQENAE